ncbi:MAG: hypothetical protein QME64_07215 [bacterium]|nr:hypothetical protein [bacterium]
MSNIHKTSFIFWLSILFLFVQVGYGSSADSTDKSAIIARLNQHYYDRIKLFQAENQAMKKWCSSVIRLLKDLKLTYTFPVARLSTGGL